MTAFPNQDITYVVISDLHSLNPGYVGSVINALQYRRVNGLVLNGDLVGDSNSFGEERNLAYVLNYARQSGLETFVAAGCSELVRHVPIIKGFIERFPGKIIYTIETPFVDKGDHHLVFLSGYDWNANGPEKHFDTKTPGFILISGENKSGYYTLKNGVEVYATNMEKHLNQHVREPSKTILFSHMPPYFGNLETAIDIATYWVVQETFSLDKKVAEALNLNQTIDRGTEIPEHIANYLIKNYNCRIEPQAKHVGSRGLADLLDKKGVSKVISGHTHSSVGRAHNRQGIPIRSGLWTEELFWNASYMDQGKFGILHVKDQRGLRVHYENFEMPFK